MRKPAYDEFVISRSHAGLSGPMWMSRETIRKIGMSSPELEKHWKNWDRLTLTRGAA